MSGSRPLLPDEAERVDDYLGAMRAMVAEPPGLRKERLIRRAEAAFYLLEGPAVSEGLRRARAEGLL